MINLIVNADDYGISHEVNEAVKLCFEKRLINQTTVMVNMPYLEEAVLYAKQGGYDDKVGLHLNLVEGSPLTEEIKNSKLCDENGYFNGNIMKNKNRFYLDIKTQIVVKQEIRAQIEKYLAYGFELKHIDSHQHSHTNLSVIPILMPLLKRYNFQSIRLSRNIPKNTERGFKGMYKHLINNMFRYYNKSSSLYRSISNFGSRSDIEMEYKTQKPENVEMMVHPLMHNGKLLEAYDSMALDVFLSNSNILRTD